MGFLMKLRILFCLTAMAISLFAFQNCSKDGSRVAVATSDKENGEGYSGKVNYQSRASSQPCADGLPHTAVVVTDGNQASLTRQNCAAVANIKIPFSSVDFLPHNLHNLAYGGFAFDRSDTTDGFSSLFCRGRSTSPGGENRAVDAIIKTHPGNPATVSAHVILGIYDSAWNLIQTNDMGEVLVSHLGSMGGPQLYNSAIGSPDIFTLDVTPDMTARLSYGKAPPSTDGIRMVDGITCYAQ